jgi:hypothetical protein
MDKNKEVQGNSNPITTNQDLLLLYITKAVSTLVQIFLSSIFLYWFWNNHLVVLSFYRLPTLQFGFFPTCLISIGMLSRVFFSGLFYAFPNVIFTSNIVIPNKAENNK